MFNVNNINDVYENVDMNDTFSFFEEIKLPQNL